MKVYNKILFTLTLLLIILFPIIPTLSTINGDILIYLLILTQIIGFVFLKEERSQVFSIIKNLFKDKIIIYLIGLNIVMYLSTLVAIDKHSSITHSIRFSMYIFIFYTISYKFKNDKSITIIKNSFIGVAILSSLITLYQIIYTYISKTPIDNEHRLASFLENSNNLGAYTIFSLFIVLLLLLNSRSKKSIILYSFCSLALLINIIASQSRNALIALFIGSILVAIIYDKRFLIASIILPLILLILPVTRDRIFQIFDFSQNSSRIKIWNTAGLMIKENPILGVGNHNFPANYMEFVEKNPDSLFVYNNFSPQHPHNIFLKIQCELGLIGSFFFLGFILITTFLIIKNIKLATDKKIKALLIGICSSFLAFQFMNILDSYYDAPKVIICMFFILGIANYYILDNKKNA